MKYLILLFLLSGCCVNEHITPDFINHQHSRFESSYRGDYYEKTQSFFLIESNKYNSEDKIHNKRENLLFYIQFDLSEYYNKLTDETK